MTMARRPSTAESVPATVNKPDHIVISFALSASVSRHATNRSSRLLRRNHASNRSGRRWRGCRFPETVSGTTAGNSKSVNRPRGSARSQLQLPSRRPNHQKRPHLSSADSRTHSIEQTMNKTSRGDRWPGAEASVLQAEGRRRKSPGAGRRRMVRPVGQGKALGTCCGSRSRNSTDRDPQAGAGPLLSPALRSKSASRFRDRALAPDCRQGLC